jgi:murein DD-endopeptidase MepM/ murein hydrolase activator NlpD
MHFISIAITSLLLLAGPGLVGGPVVAGWPPGEIAPGRHDEAAGPDYGTYEWPVNGPVIRPFDAPPDPYAPGHRGIDVGAPFGTTIVAPKEGIVAFAGWVGGSLYISIDHPDGVRTTYSWLSSSTVSKGDPVGTGDPIGATGRGHADVPTPHLHFGARVGSTYIDPMLLLERGSVVGLIHLAPLEKDQGGGRSGQGRPT